MEEIKKLSDDDLITLYKKTKKAEFYTAVVIALFVGVSIYSAFNKGLSIFTFSPLLFAYFLYKENTNKKVIKTEMDKRNLTVNAKK